jgi:Zn-finger nucleic acid-binding protein
LSELRYFNLESANYKGEDLDRSRHFWILGHDICMQCPRCQSQNFIESQYEKVLIDTCQDCHGVWLDEGEINQIIQNKEKQFSTELVKSTIIEAFSGIPAIERSTVMPCPKCAAHMNPVNYAISSGVIVDRCPNNHGLWLDKLELEKVQAYREYWQDEVHKHEKDFVSLLQKNEAKIKQKSKEKNDQSVLYTLAEIFSRLF